MDAVATTDIVSNPREHLGEDGPTLLVSFARPGTARRASRRPGWPTSWLTECHHLVITCNVDGQLARTHSGLRVARATHADGANDRGFAMTSSFTCMVLAARLVLGGRPGRGLVDRLAHAAEQVLDAGSPDSRGSPARGYERIVYLGSGPLTGLAASRR